MSKLSTGRTALHNHGGHDECPLLPVREITLQRWGLAAVNWAACTGAEAVRAATVVLSRHWNMLILLGKGVSALELL